MKRLSSGKSASLNGVQAEDLKYTQDQIWGAGWLLKAV